MNQTVLRRMGVALLVFAGAALAIVAVLVANVDRIARRTLTYALAAQTGAGVRLDEVHLGFRDGSFLLRNLVLSNPPGFQSRALLILPELYLVYDPIAAASNRVRFREVRLNLEELNLEVDASGRTNLMELAGTAAHARGLKPGPANTNLLAALDFGGRFDGIDRLSLSLGRIAYQDQRDPGRNLSFQLGITNLTFSQVTSPAQWVLLALKNILRAGLTAEPGPISKPER